MPFNSRPRVESALICVSVYVCVLVSGWLSACLYLLLLLYFCEKKPVLFLSPKWPIMCRVGR